VNAGGGGDENEVFLGKPIKKGVVRKFGKGPGCHTVRIVREEEGELGGYSKYRTEEKKRTMKPQNGTLPILGGKKKKRYQHQQKKEKKKEVRAIRAKVVCFALAEKRGKGGRSLVRRKRKKKKGHGKNWRRRAKMCSNILAGKRGGGFQREMIQERKYRGFKEHALERKEERGSTSDAHVLLKIGRKKTKTAGLKW